MNSAGPNAAARTTAAAALRLTLLAREGGITALLSDGRTLAELGTAPASLVSLAALQRDFDGAPAEGEAALLAAARRLFDEGVPSSIGRHLRSAPPGGTLALQLDPALAELPWELAFDGELFLGERWCVARRIVTGEASAPAPPPSPRWGPLEVRVHRGHHRRDAAAASEDTEEERQRAFEDDLVTRLSARAGLSVSSSATEQPADVVHFLGCGAEDAADLAALESLESLAASPALRVWQGMSHAAGAHERHEGHEGHQTQGVIGIDRRFALAAAQRGFTVLALASAPGEALAIDFVLALYRSLAQGAAIGAAVRSARSELRQRHGIAALARVHAEVHGDADRVARPLHGAAPGEDNVRQVTSLSFDLVGSTRLIDELRAERYSEVWTTYQRLTAGILARHGGAADNPQGDDGFMCYFGLHSAREDAATRAVQAALEVIDAVAALGVAVRIGGSTGEVVVRDGLPFGRSVNFAARLQSIAAPGTLLVAEATMRLARGRYRFERLADVPGLKGFPEHEAVYRVAGPAAAHEDAASAEPAGASPFVGREAEMRALHSHWSVARTGQLRLVRLTGEAGIGKSRLLREFKRMLAAEGHEVIEYRCAAEHANSAWRPVVEALRHQLQIGADTGGGNATAGEARVAHAHAALGRLAAATAAPEEAAALLAALLGVPLPPGHVLDSLPPERRRQRTLELLVELARLRARRGSGACMIVEDVHWIDPSTRELIDRIASDAAGEPLLVVLSTRADAEARWQPAGAVHDEELKGLPAEAARQLVEGVGGTARLPSEIVHSLAARTDGVPLFIEESTRMAVELGAAWADNHAALMRQVPSTLLDLLTARLDRLAGAKQLAQICGTVGREFSLPLVRAVLAHPGSPFHVDDLAGSLAALTHSGMLAPRGGGTGEPGRYRFKHALIRDAAYRSLLERDRKRLHGVVAAVLGEQFAELAQAQPELQAFHLGEAGQFAEALRAWEAAARQAASRSAHVEAINHLAAALAALARAPAGPESQRAELRLQLLLATRLIATEGYGAERVERVYARAMELATALADAPAQMKVLLGLQAYHSARAEFDKALAIAADARARSANSGAGAGAGAEASSGEGAGAIHRIQLQWAVANVIMHQGDMEAAVVQMDECLAEYDRFEHRSTVVQDPGVMCLCYSAWAMWQLGFPDQAMQRVRTVVERAGRLKHDFSLGQAFGFLGAIHLFRGEFEAARAAAARAIEICERGGFAMWLSLARLIRGRALAETGAAAEGVAEMAAAHALWRSTGTVLTTPFYLALRAEGLALAGRAAEGLALLDEALAVIERCGERYYEAEVRRLRGVLVLQQQGAAQGTGAAAAGDDESARREEAERWLQGALASARSRRLRSLALRAATSLAELWRGGGRAAEAAALLDEAMGAIDEGRETRDLVRARALRDELAAAAAAAPG